MNSRRVRLVAFAAVASLCAVACSDGEPPEAFAPVDTSDPATASEASDGVGDGATTLPADASSSSLGSSTPMVTDGADATDPLPTATTNAGAAPTTVSPGSTAPVPATTATTVPAGPDPLAIVQAYAGGTPGVADPAAGTFAIGWVNQEGGAPSFSDATLGFAAAVDFVNRSLSGVSGRVVELHTCAIQREADGARCAQQMRDDAAVSVVVVGAVTVGNAGLLDGLKDVKPVVLANPLTTSDYLATDAVAYTPGAPGVISGLARFASERLPAGKPLKVAVLFPFGLAGEAAFQLLAKPVFERFGVAVVPVPVIESAAPADYAPLFRTAGIADADVFLPILGSRGCVGLDQALVDLASSAAVLATDSCTGTAMTSHLAGTGRSGSLPEGWYVGGSGYRFGLAGNAEQTAYLDIVVAYEARNALPVIDATAYAAASFATVMTVLRLVNSIGPDAVTPESMRSATRGFGGPMWGVVGPMSCGFDAFYPSLCGTQMGVQRYVGAAWTSVADGYNGSSIELGDLRAS